MYDVFPLDNHNCILLFRRLSILANKIRESVNGRMSSDAVVKINDLDVGVFLPDTSYDSQVSLTISNMPNDHPAADIFFSIKIEKSEQDFHIYYTAAENCSTKLFEELLNKIEKSTEYNIKLMNERKEQKDNIFKDNINRILTTCI